MFRPEVTDCMYSENTFIEYGTNRFELLFHLSSLYGVEVIGAAFEKEKSSGRA